MFVVSLVTISNIDILQSTPAATLEATGVRGNLSQGTYTWELA
jgi:hypothetical protein